MARKMISNLYWENANAEYIKAMDTDRVIKRIEECVKVIESSRSDAFAIFVRDRKEEREYIDSIWHELDDEKKLRELRVKKIACDLALSFAERYTAELKQLNDEMESRNSKDNITRDYDDSTPGAEHDK